MLWPPTIYNAAREGKENRVNLKKIVRRPPTIVILMVLAVTGLIIIAIVPSSTPQPLATIASAFLGLLGVAATLLYNASKDRNIQQQQQEKENARAQDDALQKFLNQISDPKTYKPLRKGAKQGYRRAVMRAKLKTLLLGSDGERKGILLLFLNEAKLIKREEELLKRNREEKLLKKEGAEELLKRKREEEEEEEEDKREKWNYPILSLKDIDLSKTELNSAVLVHVDLSGANLNKADLRGADLRGADLSNTNLRGSILCHAKLDPYIYEGVDTTYDTPTTYSTPINLSGADLREAKGLTDKQIAQAIGDQNTQLPDGIEHPKAWDETFEEQLRRIGELTASVTAVDPVDGTAVLEEAPGVSGGDRV